MGLISEFKEFALKGNVMDLAVGVIIGGAFGKIVSSVVADVIMPPIGIVMGGVNFADLKLILREATTAANGQVLPAVTLNYGNFLQASIDFLLVAFAVFLMIKAINSIKREQAAPPPAAPQEAVLLTEIRDLLKTAR